MVNSQQAIKSTTINDYASMQQLIGLVGISIINYTGSDLTYHDFVFIKVTLIVGFAIIN